MYQRVLLRTDGGDGVESAIEHALELAEAHDAERHVLHVIDDASLASVSEDAMGEVRKRAADVVDAVV